MVLLHMKMPSVTELSVLIGVVGWLKPSLWSVMRRVTADWPLWNSPPTYASATDSTMYFRILHSVWICPFSGWGGLEIFPDWLVARSGNSALQYVCAPVVMVGMMHHCQCVVSYCYICIGQSRTYWWMHSLETVWLQFQYSELGFTVSLIFFWVLVA